MCVFHSDTAQQKTNLQLPTTMLSKNKRPYDPNELPPSRRLRMNLGNLLSRNELPATRVGELANDINRVAPTEVRDITGPLGGNTARKLRRNFLKKSTWMPDYIPEIRTWSPKAQKVRKEKVPMQLIHEIIAALLKHGFRDKLLSKEHLDPLTLEHLLHCESEAGCELLGIGIWGDGAPTQWDRGESIDVISISLPGIVEFHELRIPLVVLPHSRVCSETWQDVFAIVKWSFVILATGVWPTRRHDGSEWQNSDNCRTTARPLLRSALVEVRQDWKFAAEVWGFPAHNTAAGCCWACTCTPAEVHGVEHTCSPRHCHEIYTHIHKCVVPTHRYIYAHTCQPLLKLWLRQWLYTPCMLGGECTPCVAHCSDAPRSEMCAPTATGEANP